MPKLIILVALGLAVWISLHQLKRLPPERRKSQLINVGIWLAIAIAVFAVITGRLHWLGAIIAGAVGILKAALPWLIKAWPLIASSTQKEAPEPIDEELQTAYKTLGLKVGASREQVIEAHRKLMLKMHPDKGGNHQDASAINAAKRRIIEALNED